MAQPKANDLNALLQTVLEQARAAGIPVAEQIDPAVQLNARATGRFGRCLSRSGRYTIELSDRFLTAPPLACMQTLAHEVLHTCRGCANHGERWKAYAQRMNAAYGYHISRTDTCEALGVPDRSQANYVLVCQRCGAKITRQRRSALIQHPERYRCRCGGTLKRAEPD